MKRREFLRWGAAGAASSGVGVAAKVAAAIGATGAAIVGYTFAVEPHWLEIVERPLPIAGLPPSLAGKRLVHLSDLHVGRQVSDAYLIKSLERAKRLDPDIIAITGDLITYVGSEQFPQLRGVLRHLPHGRLATIAVLGNHDYGFGWRMPDVAAAVERELRDAGVTVLHNEVADVNGLAIIGLGDLWANNFMPERVLPSYAGGPAVALSHNPDSLDLGGWSGYRGWVLAGHTHGGQCKPPFLPPPLLPVRNTRYTAGAIPLIDGRAVYISRGIGHLIPVRFNVRPEITAFTLTASPANTPASAAIDAQAP